MDADFLKAQFESAMKLVEWAVTKCAEQNNAELGENMRRSLERQSAYLGRRLGQRELPKVRANRVIQGDGMGVK